ncbi:breast carcinoma-amplified sequence 1 isoform X2 [Solea solea]|uniref:breast carcinoma-amplified sequence 1 isoform X2 n=1 Tax=Solea solea TaxID=90069 RepID=UPI00272C993F|nr:breast carcinoma-amplified sequence 1 isoform X2 [Solea solea]
MGNEQSNNKEPTQNGKLPEKHENGSVNGVSANMTFNGLEVDVNGGKTVHGEVEAPEPDFVVVESDSEPTEAQPISEIPELTIPKEEVKKSKSLFGKMFKKKDVTPPQQKETTNEDETDVSPAVEAQPETANLKQDSESLTEPESVTPEPGQAEENLETDNGNSQPEENPEEENNSVMNFFKTLVTPTKTSKKETATPDAKKDQVAQISEPPAAPKGMSIPPPPPPEPPKMEIKGDPAVKPVKPSPKEEPKAAAKQGKSAKDSLSRFFRSKSAKETPQAAEEAEVEPGEEEPVVEPEAVDVQVVPPETAENEAQMVDGEPQSAEKVDPSKTGTLEAAAKPEPPPPVQEEKNTAPTVSFFSLFKPKAAEPKKEAAAAPPVATEAAQAVKIKEEPKPVAKSSEVENKQASVGSQAGEDVANIPKKEKRNSVHQLFKFLGQKRHSTDAGVQTESITVTAEKAK